MITKLTKVLFAVGVTFGLSSCVRAQTNIALNAEVTTNIPSNYALTKDKNPAQLVDGVYAGSEFNAAHKTSSLWVQKGSITWRVGKDPIIVTIDMGKTMPISGVSLSTAAGSAGVQFPSFAGIAVSEDGKTWNYQGDLIGLSRKNAVPDLTKYTKHRFVTYDLQTKGRYVALAIRQSPYTVTDEIEVYKGNDAWLDLPAGGEKLPALDIKTFNAIMESSVTQHFVQRRVASDIRVIRAQIQQSQIGDARKSTFLARLDKAAQDNENLKLEAKSLKTILPITPTHRDVMAVYGDFLATQNIPALAVWKQHRYAWTPFIATPQRNAKPSLDISMLRNQFRADALLVTNASDSPKTVSLRLQNPPSGAQQGWLQLSQAVWTDTYQGTAVADALLPIAEANSQWQMQIPAGFTGKIWLTVDSSKVPTGAYKSTFIVDQQRIPLNIDISTITMERPRLSLTLWDYTDPRSMQRSASRGVTAENHASALQIMQSYFVDSPWATRGILPFPKEEDFDANHNLTQLPDFSNFDQWIAQWPEARTFFVFISAGENESFAGAKRGTDEFKTRLGSWAKVLSAHVRKLGLSPNQLALLINDEPGIRGAWQDDVTADWGRAINATAPELTLISDPVWDRPDEESHQDALSQMDILMPNTQKYVNSVEEVPAYFQQQRAAGKDLWLYACTGPVRLFNPQQYYRGQAWRVFEMGGKGMGYWAFGDIGGAPTTWHDYQISRSFAPVFIDTDSVHSSVNWESLREGVEDFEELAMLRDAISSAKEGALKTQAQQILAEAVTTVIATRTHDDWHKEENPQYTDLQLQKVRNVLEKLLTK